MSDPKDLSAGDKDSSVQQRELRLVTRQLKWQLIEHEHNLESLQRVRRQRAKLREQAQSLAAALAECRSDAYWAEQSAPARAALWFGRTRAADPEADLVREVEAAEQFDGGWYFQQHPSAVRSGLSPAVHYVRHGNAKKLDPGPRFSTSGYIRRHPEAGDSGIPALLHAIRHGNTGETTTAEADSTPADDLHL